MPLREKKVESDRVRDDCEEEDADNNDDDDDGDEAKRQQQQQKQSERRSRETCDRWAEAGKPWPQNAK